MLVRSIVIGALKDLGSGSDLDREKVCSWIKTRHFEEMCSFAGWSDEWMVDVFRRVDELEGEVRKSISDQCIHMLKFIP